MNTATKNKTEKVSFEDSLEKLEELVHSLESGELSLDESLKQFEEGVSLYKSCRDQLDKTEKKLSLLTDQLTQEKMSLRGEED